jgi:hypothetical protein
MGMGPAVDQGLSLLWLRPGGEGVRVVEVPKVSNKHFKDDLHVFSFCYPLPPFSSFFSSLFQSDST